MSKFQAVCTNCHEAVWVTDDAAGDQVNCPQCHTIFSATPPAPPRSAAAKDLELVADRELTSMKLNHYETLAAGDITPNSSMETIQRFFPDTEEEFEAHLKLSHLHSRLMVDLFMYPVWKETD